ncbi:MAG: lamin tail domain-containing protein [Haloarculaceae archaeon]
MPIGNLTRWNRLTPDARNETMRKGLRALVADPLWMLGRQWQVGEMTGEDAGSPVAVELWLDHDPMTAVDPATDDTEPRPYDHREDGPLEALVEREPVLSHESREPNRETAVEAGRYFLALLDEKGFEVDGRSARAEDFPALQLSDPEHETDSAGERYMSVVEGRSIDGCALFDQLTQDSSILEAEDADAVGWDAVREPAVGAGSAVFREAEKDFVDWYADLYDEPAAGAESAWNPDRMEYEFRAATGADGTETVFSADEYPGGRLDWDAFSVVQRDEASLTDQLDGDVDTDTVSVDHPGGETGAGGTTLNDDLRSSVDRNDPDMTMMPSKVSFPGMPSHRWWEMEDGEVNIGNIEVGPGELGKLLLTEHATLYGNDWFSIPLEVPVGSLTRVEEFLVTDTFGQVTRVEPAVQQDGSDATSTASADVGEETSEGAMAGALAESGGWNMFMHAGLPRHDRPGLLVPPVLGAHHESDPVERVVLARDEMANMAFGIELVTEDAIGNPLQWSEFALPALDIDTVRQASDPGDERVRVKNTGESPLDIGGWTVTNVDYEDYETGSGDRYTFPDGTIVGPGEHLTLYSGTGNDAEPSALYWGRTDAPVWNDSEVATVVEPDGEGGETIAAQEYVGTPDNPGLPDYRLVTDIRDYWFPLQMVPAGERGAGEFAVGDLRFQLARLLDADLELNTPAGRILYHDDGDPILLHDEELTREGVEVTRTYQYSRWVDGAVHLWSGRRAGPGRGEGSSGLRYDILVEPDAADAGADAE